MGSDPNFCATAKMGSDPNFRATVAPTAAAKIALKMGSDPNFRATVYEKIRGRAKKLGAKVLVDIPALALELGIRRNQLYK
jgi:hypothetical protein